ncbi:hypothetical protein NH340_JMT06806 [Sarcoptes scabiei]|nr:hypothetical protein NH340_JMT06806 [Sarcoptes scabiei]
MGANCTHSSLDQFGKEWNSQEAIVSDLKLVSTGLRQSPIDIDLNMVQKNFSSIKHSKHSNRLAVKYPNLMSNLVIQNTGYGWKFDLPEMVAAKTELKGGPLRNHIYRMCQFHCHWGVNLARGSEHTINGRSYAAELHFVHWNTSLFSAFSEALSQTHGLAVVAVFIEIGFQKNKELEKVLKQINAIKFKGNRKLVEESIDIAQLMPNNKSYWTYQGSLTTPPLFESVTWIIYSNPIYATIDQLKKFRHVFYTAEADTSFGGRLIENHRSTQPLNGRLVQYIPDSVNDSIRFVSHQNSSNRDIRRIGNNKREKNFYDRKLAKILEYNTESA